MATLENEIHKKEEKLLTHMNILEYQLALEHPQQLLQKLCHFTISKAYFIILLHHFTIFHLSDVLYFYHFI